MISWLDGYSLQLLKGTVVTLIVAVSSLFLGLILGLVGAAGELSHLKILQKTSRAITTVLRGLPELLIIFALYFGGTALLSSLFQTNVEVNALTAGIIALSLIFGAYATQTFRGGFLAISKGQREAAQALGLSQWRVFKQVLLPQAFKHALPGLGNLWLVLLKDTALVSLIGLADLMNTAQLAASTTRKPFTFYFVAALIYLALTTASQFGIRTRYREKIL